MRVSFLITVTLCLLLLAVGIVCDTASGCGGYANRDTVGWCNAGRTGSEARGREGNILADT